MPYGGLWAATGAQGGGVLPPQRPTSAWERERGGFTRLLSGFVPGLWNIAKDITKLGPLPGEAKTMRALFGMGPQKSLLLEGVKHTVGDIWQIPWSVLPGGMKPSETDISKRVRAGSSYTEELVNDIANIALGAGTGAKVLGAAGKVAELGGAAETAARLGTAAGHLVPLETPIRSALAAGAARARVGAEAATAAGELGRAAQLGTRATHLAFGAHPFAESRAALERVALEHPELTSLPARAGMTSLRWRTRGGLMGLLKGVGEAQQEAAVLPHVKAAYSAAQDLVRLDKNLTVDDAVRIVAQDLDRKVTGLGAFGEQVINPVVEKLGMPPETPYQMPDDLKLREKLDYAEEQYRVHEQKLAGIKNIPERMVPSPKIEKTRAKAIRNLEQAQRAAEDVGLYQQRLFGAGAPVPIEAPAGLFGSGLVDITNAEALRSVAEAARMRPPRPTQEALLQRAQESALAADRALAEGGAARGVAGFKASQAPQEVIRQAAGMRGVMPEMGARVADLIARRRALIESQLTQKLLPAAAEMTPSQVWGPEGQMAARWMQQGAEALPEARAMASQAAAIRGNAVQLGEALRRSAGPEARRLGVAQERFRNLVTQAETPTFGEGKRVGTATERARQLARRAGESTYQQGYSVGREFGRVSDTIRELRKAEGIHAKKFARGLELADKALRMETDIDSINIVDVAPEWQPLVGAIKSIRTDVRQAMKEATASHLEEIAKIKAEIPTTLPEGASKADIARAIAAHPRVGELAGEAASIEKAYGDMMVGVPDNLGRLFARAEELGVNPAYIGDYTEPKAMSLAVGTPRLGAGMYSPVGRELEAGYRKTRTGALRRSGQRADSITALQAAHVEVAHEVATNAAAQMAQDMLQAVPEGGLPSRMWVEWDRATGRPGAGTGEMLPKVVADQLKRFSKEKPDSSILYWAGRIQNPWRHMVLTLSPSWYVNNAFGNALMATVEGVRPIDWARSWIAQRRSDLGPVAGVRGVNLAERLGASRLGAPANLPEALPAKLRNVSLSAELGPEGRVSRAMRERVRRVSGGRITNFDPRRANSFVDELARTAVFMKGLRTGDTMEQAAARATKALVDFSNLSPFERDVVRKVVPFYAWQKGILKFVKELPVDHPYKAALISQIGQYAGGWSPEERRRFPEYMFGSVALGGGGRLSTKGMNPFQDSLSLITADGMINSLSPVLTVPMRALLDKPETGVFTSKYRVSATGQLEPDVTAGEQAIKEFRSLPAIRTFFPEEYATIAPKPLGQRLAGFAGFNIRDPAAVQRALERTAKSRKAVLTAQRRESKTTAAGTWGGMWGG